MGLGIYQFKIQNSKFKIKNFWGLGIGDWGLGIGDWGLGKKFSLIPLISLISHPTGSKLHLPHLPLLPCLYFTHLHIYRISFFAICKNTISSDHCKSS
jgi:hypothetical protein